MIWLTWRQHRKQLLFALIGLAAIAVLMLLTGKTVHDAFTDTGLASCLPTTDRSPLVSASFESGGAAQPDAHCRDLASQFADRFANLSVLSILFVMLPLFVGLFFGAPLVAREIEQGTHRLVWTQGITRRRWAVTKFGFIAAVTMVLAGGYAWLATWWNAPLARAGGDGFDYGFFDQRGIVPVAYTLFAVALGVFAGTIWRRVLPAMAVTLVGFLGVRIAVAVLARPRYLPPQRLALPITDARAPNRLLGDWVLSTGVHGGNGELLQPNSRFFCSPNAPDCLARFGPGAYNLQVYQPASHYWPFQYIESGLFVALAGLLLFLAMNQVRRRIS